MPESNIITNLERAEVAKAIEGYRSLFEILPRIKPDSDDMARVCKTTFETAFGLSALSRRKSAAFAKEPELHNLVRDLAESLLLISGSPSGIDVRAFVVQPDALDEAARHLGLGA
jgi:hypothetical protein